MHVGIGTRCKEDAEKCPCSFYIGLNVSTDGSATKGSFHKFLISYFGVRNNALNSSWMCFRRFRHTRRQQRFYFAVKKRLTDQSFFHWFRFTMLRCISCYIKVHILLNSVVNYCGNS